MGLSTSNLLSASLAPAAAAEGMCEGQQSSQTWGLDLSGPNLRTPSLHGEARGSPDFPPEPAPLTLLQRLTKALFCPLLELSIASGIFSF